MAVELAGVERWARAHWRSIDRAVAALLALGLAPFSAVVLLGGHPVTAWAFPQLAAVVVVHAAVAWRRAAPTASFAALSGALAYSELAPGLPGNTPFVPSAVVFPVGLYAYCVARRPWLGAAVGAVGALLITGRVARTSDASVPTLLLLYGLLLAVVTASVAAALVRTARDRLAAAEREDQVRRERDRIARELHDVVAHSLAVIVSQAQGAAYVAGTRPDRAVAALDTIAETGRDALADMRGLVGVLRATPAGPAEPPQPGLADLAELVAGVRCAGLPVELAATGSPGRLAAATQLAAYRLVQEGLTNTLKHAGPGATARVGLTWTEAELVVEVTDDGAGPVAGGAGGHGLAGMRERVALAGGTVRAGERAGGGFAVRAALPRDRR